MASLTHVCMWSKNGWRHISAEEASKLHTGGTVSAHSGLFMCELCGQYVILTDGDIRVRYFKHSAYEKAKIARSAHLEQHTRYHIEPMNMICQFASFPLLLLLFDLSLV